MEDKAYFKYWGKARKEGEGDALYHLLPYHCLDVAAVGDVLLHLHSGLRKRLSRLSGLDDDVCYKWIVYFLAIHDLGKFSESFQNLRPDILLALQDKQSEKAYSLRHDTLGETLWLTQVRDLLLGDQGRSPRGRILLSGLDFWAQAVMGHHGTPPKQVDNEFDYFTKQDKSAAMSFVDHIADFLLADKNSLAMPEISTSKWFSWWLAGFAVLCDWLGSNSEFFEFCTDEMPLEKYWDRARQAAHTAINEAELIPAKASPLKQLEVLFSPRFKSPTPLQALCDELPIGQGANLFILEDVTGAGKTEAAVVLLHRILAQGEVEGVYFALPTMATANAMYERMGSVYQKLYAEGERPSLVLAHGARELSDRFRHSILPMQQNGMQGYGDDTQTASAHCGAWLADNRKKALLAEVGVGTIDQSLLAILPSKHQSLRMLGLLGKVLIVDEVHACDAYVNELLCALLKAHASTGGSAILLSATLPASQRQKLLNAYADGCQQTRTQIQATGNDAYPLLTHYANDQLHEQMVATRESVKRRVNVEMVCERQQVLERIQSQIEDGCCVCWVRNTVDDAREAYAKLKALLPNTEVVLFHARYAMTDRLAIEDKILHHFGRDSTAALRKSRVLIATQVVEQSLDLDFDLMVTDLAPIDLIIQRAGRLRRHARTIDGTPLEGKDQRGTPELIVYGPNTKGDIQPDWYKAYFKGGAAVYPNHAQLWITAKLLADKQGFAMPDDARMLIEGVYGDKPYPETLQNSESDAVGKQSAMRSVATLNALKLDAGYGSGDENCWWDETVTPTRLGEESITVYLAHWDGQNLTPWACESEHAWANSAVQIRKALIAREVNDGVPLGIVEKVKQQLPAQGKWGVLLVLTIGEDGCWKGVAKDGNGKQRSIEYSEKLGLIVGKA